MTPSPKDAVLRLRGVGRSFSLGSTRIEALAEIHLEVQAGELVAIQGPSGCGKTTLLQIAGLLDAQHQGGLSFLERDTTGLSARERARLRLSQVGFVFQDFRLLPSLSVLDNVALPHWYLTGKKRKARGLALEQLTRLGLQTRLDHRPDQLSAGESQRTALARALINRPRLILADEPTAHLEQESTGVILALLQALPAEGSAVLVASHDPQVIGACPRVVRLAYGRQVEPGTDPAGACP